MQTLKEMPIWVVWKYETVNGKRTKVLYSAKTKNKCGTNEKYQVQWVLFEEASNVAANANFDGVGFVIPRGYAVIDMDHLEDENVPQQIGSLIPSYMEVSPSGEGRHIVAKVDVAAIPTEDGKLAPAYYVKNPHNHLELYIGGLTNRYMTFTGNAVNDIAVVDCTKGILAFLEKYMKREKFRKASSIADEEEEAKKLSDFEIIQIAGGRAKNADKFNKLYVQGDKSEYGSGSEADLALCNYIAFYSQGDEETIDRLYRSSAIMRDKWEREDYRKSTIQKAIALCGGEFYTGKVPMPPFIWEDEKERRHVSCPLLAKYFREHQHMLSVRDTGRSGVQRYIYEDGCYRPYADEMIKGLIKKYITDYDESLLVRRHIVGGTYRTLISVQ
ncbi:MAG: hypothetical protein ACLUX8_08085, partial [Clostridium sp.]